MLEVLLEPPRVLVRQGPGSLAQPVALPGRGRAGLTLLSISRS